MGAALSSLVEEITLQSEIHRLGDLGVSSTPVLVELQKDTLEFMAIVSRFVSQWRHPTATPKVVKIWKIHCFPYINNRFLEHQKAIASKSSTSWGNTRLLWHGTIRACRIGDSGNSICTRSDCSLCGILKMSFSVAKVGQHHKFSRFGAGMYTTSTSSKANDYVQERGGSPYKAMLLNTVVAGVEAKMTRNDMTLSKPPGGCDSVLGVPGVNSVLNYDEVVVYRDDAIRPLFLVIYC